MAACRNGDEPPYPIADGCGGSRSHERQVPWTNSRLHRRVLPEIVAQAQAVLAKTRAHLPGAIELVYDHYNALAIGFGPTD